MTTTMEYAISALVIIAIIVSASTLYYGFSVMDKVTALGDSILDLTDSIDLLKDSVEDLTDEVEGLGADVTDIRDRLQTVEDRLQTVEDRLRPQKIVWYAAMLEKEWELYKPIVEEFTYLTGIKVEVVLYGGAWGDLYEKLQAETEAGAPVADVVTIDDFLTGAAMDYVADITDYVEEWGELANVSKRIVVNEEVYYLGWRADCLTMYVNIDKLAEYGLEPPETMDDLLTVAETLYQEEGTGRVGMKGKKYEGLTCELAIFLNAFGGNYLVMNSTENIEAFEYLQNLGEYLHPGSKTYDEGNIPDAICAEEIYIDFNWPYQAAIIEERELSDTIKPFPNPMGPAGKRGTTTGGGYLAISKLSLNKDAAWEFVKFLVSKKGQGMQLSHVGWLPSRADAWDYLETVDPDKYDEVSETLEPYSESVEYNLPRAPVPEYPELSALWQDAFWDIVWDGEPVETTLDAYQAQWEDIQG